MTTFKAPSQKHNPEDPFRFLIPNSIFNQLINLCAEDSPDCPKIGGYLLGQRYSSYIIIDRIQRLDSSAGFHVPPKSWMKLKKRNIYTIREIKAEKVGKDKKPITVVYPFHTHPSGDLTLHEIDRKILEYYGSGVIVICTKDDVHGWSYKRPEQGKKSKGYGELRFEIFEDVPISPSMQ